MFQTIFVSNNSSPKDSILPFENALGNRVWETRVWKLSVSHSISKCIFKWKNQVFWTQIVRNENSLKRCLTNKIVWGIWLFFFKIPVFCTWFSSEKLVFFFFFFFKNIFVLLTVNTCLLLKFNLFLQLTYLWI